jgi:hypothetical protein
MAEVPVDGPNGPTIIDTEEALRMVNTVREALKMDPLSALPQAEPNSACNCVLAKSWDAVLYYDSPRDDDELPEPVDALVRLGGNDSADAAGSDSATRKAAKALSLKTRQTGGVVRMVMPSDHPLLVWMWAFDTRKLPDLIDPKLRERADESAAATT